MLLRRILLYSAVAVLGLIAFVYFAFLAIMRITEAHWLEAPPFHASIDVRSQTPHQIALLDEGIVSLAERLRLIASAEKSLDLEFFIYELDHSSRIVSQALAKKAREGVKVRVLVDFSLAVFKLRPGYAQLLKEAGVDVKYYNTASVARFFRVQHRTHRKLLLVDGRAAVLGGRNIADDYFDLSPHYNFLDSDVVVEGEVVKAIQESFDLYWESPWALDPKDAIDEPDETPDPAVADFLTENDQDRATLATVATATSTLPPPSRSTCGDVSFVTDYPGSGVNYRRVFPAIVKILAEADSEVLVESPYFVIRPDGADVIRVLTERGVGLKVLTNSLRSTDAYYTVAALLPMLHRLAAPRFGLWAYRGDRLAGYGKSEASERWGVHAKRAVIDGDTVLIGTYNIDPRSANLNSELMLICRGDPTLAGSMRDSINRRMAQANAVIVDKDVRGFSELIAGADTKSIAMMMISLPVSTLFDFLL